MVNSESQTWYMVPLIFIILAMAVVGTEAIPPAKYYIKADESCADIAQRFVDNNIQTECIEYPYEDGNGNFQTNLADRWNAEVDEYQTPYDLFRVSTLEYIDKTGATSNKGQIGIFCDIHNNHIPFNGGWNSLINSYQFESFYDFSSSSNLITNLCTSFPPMSGDLPILQEEQ